MSNSNGLGFKVCVEGLRPRFHRVQSLFRV